METEDFQGQMLKKMNTVIALLLDLKEGSSEKEVPLREKIATLSAAGLNYKEIAQTLGKTEGHVAVELTALKKRKTKLKAAIGGE